MDKLALGKILVRKTALSAQWGTAIFVDEQGDAFIQLSDEEVKIDGFQPIRTDKTRDDITFVSEGKIFQDFEESAATPCAGGLFVHCIALQGQFVVGDIVSLGEYLKDKRNKKNLPDGLGYLEEDIDEFISQAESVALERAEEQERFIVSEREGLARFERRFSSNAREIERYLKEYVSSPPRGTEISKPSELVDAIMYALLTLGGKRLRPFLSVELALMLGADRTVAVPVGAAVEMIYTASLVHEDLPELDNGHRRRGRPTVHRAHNEAVALLTGDALYTMAYEAITSEELALTAKQKIEVVSLLARSSGVGGLVGGQGLSLSHSRSGASEEDAVLRQFMKSGALIRASCEIGAIVANGSKADREMAAAYGHCLAKAYRIGDDLIEWVQASKFDRSEHAPGNLVALRGTDWAMQELQKFIAEADALLLPYGQKAWVLRDAVRFIAAR